MAVAPHKYEVRLLEQSLFPTKLGCGLQLKEEAIQQQGSIAATKANKRRRRATCSQKVSQFLLIFVQVSFSHQTKA